MRHGIVAGIAVSLALSACGTADSDFAAGGPADGASGGGRVGLVTIYKPPT